MPNGKQSRNGRNAPTPFEQKGFRDALRLPLSAETLPAVQRRGDAPPWHHPSSVPVAAAHTGISGSRVGHRKRIGRASSVPSSWGGLADLAVREAGTGAAPGGA